MSLRICMCVGLIFLSSVPALTAQESSSSRQSNQALASMKAQFESVERLDIRLSINNESPKADTEDDRKPRGRYGSKADDTGPLKVRFRLDVPKQRWRLDYQTTNDSGDEAITVSSFADGVRYAFRERAESKSPIFTGVEYSFAAKNIQEMALGLALGFIWCDPSSPPLVKWLDPSTSDSCAVSPGDKTTDKKITEEVIIENQDKGLTITLRMSQDRLSSALVQQGEHVAYEIEYEYPKNGSSKSKLPSRWATVAMNDGKPIATIKTVVESEDRVDRFSDSLFPKPRAASPLPFASSETIELSQVTHLNDLVAHLEKAVGEPWTVKLDLEALAKHRSKLIDAEIELGDATMDLSSFLLGGIQRFGLDFYLDGDSIVLTHRNDTQLNHVEFQTFDTREIGITGRELMSLIRTRTGENDWSETGGFAEYILLDGEVMISHTPSARFMAAQIIEQLQAKK